MWDSSSGTRFLNLQMDLSTDKPTSRWATAHLYPTLFLNNGALSFTADPTFSVLSIALHSYNRFSREPLPKLLLQLKVQWEQLKWMCGSSRHKMPEFVGKIHDNICGWLVVRSS